jgi:transposase-like protein
MPKTKYSDETKAQCIAAMLKGGGFPTVSKEFGVPLSTLQYWKKNANSPSMAEVIERRESRIAELIGRYLEASLEALTAQAELFKDTEWLRKQGAKPVGILHGILLDKSVRILGAIEQAHERVDESETDGDNVVSITRTADGSNRK